MQDVRIVPMLSIFAGTWRGELGWDMHRRSVADGSTGACAAWLEAEDASLARAGRRAGCAAIRRRTLLAGLGLLFCTVPALGQAPRRPWHIGILNWTPLNLDILMNELAALGYAAGQGAEYTIRDCASRPDVAARMAGELVGMKVDMIIATSTGPARAAKKATASIPILVTAADPLRSGLVASMARPGGNLTGVSISAFDLIAKRVELARELVPGLSRIAYLGQTGEPNAEAFAAATRTAAERLGVEMQTVWAGSGDPLEPALAEAASRRVHAVIPQPIFIPNSREIAEAAARHRLPVVGEGVVYATAGGLLGYGIDRAYLWNRLAAMVDRVLRGARPADLPMEQGVRTLLSVNLSAARAIGLPVPSSIIDRADEVIE